MMQANKVRAKEEEEDVGERGANWREYTDRVGSVRSRVSYSRIIESAPFPGTCR